MIRGRTYFHRVTSQPRRMTVAALPYNLSVCIFILVPIPTQNVTTAKGGAAGGTTTPTLGQRPLAAQRTPGLACTSCSTINSVVVAPGTAGVADALRAS